MKRILFLLLPLVCLLAGCKYDDSEVWNALSSQGARIANLEALNSDIASLQRTVAALENQIAITSVKTSGNGYVISFTDGTSININNGSNGSTPAIGVKEDGGVYYWTVDGKWLLNPSGSKISTGTTPQVKIEDSQWYISYDNGKSWTKVPGQPASTDSMFKDVTTDTYNAYFTLSDGTVITIPLAEKANKLQLVFDESAFAKIRPSEVLSTTYRIEAPEGAKVDFQTYENDGWTVTIYPSDERSGRISIKSPASFTSTKVLFMLTDDNNGSFTKIIKIGLDESAKPHIQTQYTVDYKGGELTIPVTSCTAELSEGSSEWVEVTSVGDQVVLNLKSNESYDWRHSDITLEDGTVITITQLTPDALILSEKVVEIDGRRQKVPFALSTNLRITATVIEGADWLSVSPTTRALNERIFTLTATRNTTGETRTGKVVFSGNDLSDTCTVIQAVYDGPATIDVTEAIATEEGTEVELEPALVVGLTADGYVVTDGDSYIYVNDKSNKPEKGDSISFKATSAPLNGMPGLGTVNEYNKTASNARVVYPKATDITTSVDTYTASVPTLVSITGDLSADDEGKFHVSVAGATSDVIIYNPHSSLGTESRAASKDKVAVTGFWYGNVEGVLYIIATEIVTKASGEDTPSTITVYNYKKVTSVESGKSYLIVAEDGSLAYVANQITSNYGYLQKTEATLSDGTITLKEKADDKEFIFESTSSGYTIKQQDGRYVYQTGTYNSFNVNAEPADGQYWSVDVNADGTFTITNNSVNKYIQYSKGYNSYGSYSSNQDQGIMPSLYEYAGTSEIEDPDNPGGEVTPGGDDGPGGGEGTALTWETGTNGYTHEATVNGESKTVLKLGTSSKAGEATITLPAGTKSVSFYAVSWKGNVANLVFKNESGSEIFSVSPAANDGASNNSPYTISVSSSDYYTFNLGSALTSPMTVTITTSGSKTRVILFDIVAN